MRLSVIGAWVVTLSILGLIALIQLFVWSLGRSFKEQLCYDIELSTECKETEASSLGRKVERIKGIRQVHYISADSAKRAIEQTLGEDPVVILGYNPFNPYLRLQLYADYNHSDSLRNIQHALNKLGINAEELNGQQGKQLEQINRNAQVLSYLLWVVLLMQIIFTYIQINSTTGIMVYAERLQIRTLTLVGATSWFIRLPIIRKNLTDSLVACLISLGLLASLIQGASLVVKTDLWELLEIEHLLCVIVSLLLIASLSSLLASYRSTQRYINMNGEQLQIL